MTFLQETVNSTENMTLLSPHPSRHHHRPIHPTTPPPPPPPILPHPSHFLGVKPCPIHSHQPPPDKLLLESLLSPTSPLHHSNQLYDVYKLTTPPSFNPPHHFKNHPPTYNTQLQHNLPLFNQSPPLDSTTSILEPYQFNMKGIQGGINSCCLDTLLFSMFTFTNVFDSLLHRNLFNYAQCES